MSGLEKLERWNGVISEIKIDVKKTTIYNKEAYGEVEGIIIDWDLPIIVHVKRINLVLTPVNFYIGSKNAYSLNKIEPTGNMDKLIDAFISHEKARVKLVSLP
ncbi:MULTISPECIES: hypothetical protein [unclassified Priestia]|uniref:hypothetical protein n=1 Tax=unclassified Priestia TaxID=2800374 RepID=UPI003673300F